MKLLIVIGNRPHFIKCAPLLKVLQSHPEIEVNIVHSGQHYDPQLSDVFLRDFRFPQVSENLQVGSAPCSIQTGNILIRLDPVFRRYEPDVVISMGDTNTTLAAALAAYQQHIPNAHIEAGMRENIWRPEEINKRMADHCADYLFAPIPRAVDNLRREGIEEERIFLTGDITLDAFVQNRPAALDQFRGIISLYPQIPDVYDLLTLHRAETVDHPDLLLDLLRTIRQWPRPVVFPMHPRTFQRIQDFRLTHMVDAQPSLIILPPLPYIPFLALLLNAHTVATDSSGVLKEAFYAGKPCIVLDESTEYREIFDMGAAVMGSRVPESIISRLSELDKNGIPAMPPSVFGDGHASEKMLETLLTREPFFK